MRLFIFIITILTSLSTKSQTIKDIFIADAYKDFVDTTTTGFYLSESAYHFNFDNPIFMHLDEDLAKELPDSIIQFLKSSNNDTTTLLWKKMVVPKAILVNARQVDTLTGNILIVFHNESKRKRKEKNQLLNLKRNTVYFFSNPIFDKTQQYALIQMSYVCGNACGQGCIFLYHIVDGRWKKISKLNCFMS